MRLLAKFVLAVFMVLPVHLRAQDVANMPFVFHSSEATTVKPETETGPFHPAMWRLETEDTTINFLGSFHLIPPGLHWQDSRVKDAFAAANSVVFEIDMAAAKDPVFVQQLIDAGTLPAGQTLELVLSKAQYAEIEAICAKLGVPIAFINTMKPWFAATMLSMIHMEMNGFDPEAGVDEVLQKQAQRAGKRVVALESVTDQLEAFLSQDQLSADDVMENATREFDDPDYLDNMLKIWLHGDTDGLEAIIIDELGKFPAVYDALLVRRNSNWIAPLVGMINKGGSYFVVVGAGHLVGEDSVINMLRAKGYTVERF